MYIPETYSWRTADMVELFKSHMKVPVISSADKVWYTAKYLVVEYKKPATSAPFSQIGDITLASLMDLAKKFQNTLKVDEPKSKINTTKATKPAAIIIEAAPVPRVVKQKSVPRVQEPTHMELLPKDTSNEPTHISFEDGEYMRPRVYDDPINRGRTDKK